MQKNVTKTSIAALTFELLSGDGGVPTEAHLLPPGPFRAVDGRPFECDGWKLDAAIAARVIARAAAQKNDILIDFEHQSLRSEWNGQRVEAAGWIPRTMEWREGSGLYALNIVWVGDTADLIAAKKLRYISAVFLYDTVTGEVLEIISVAATNTPAMDGLDALADLARKHSVFSTEEEADMAQEKDVAALAVERDGLKTQVAALVAERDGLKTSLAALTVERDTLKAKADAAEQEKAEAALTTEKAKHGELLQAALTDGRLTPAQKGWAEKQTLAALTEYLDASKPLGILQKQTDGMDGGGHGLTEAELAMCSRMGVSPEDFTEAKGKA
ncbi:hypothetical protein SKTS_33130 [Sulfurimicrobium lacus]|uniref:Mu phage protease GpI n=1 Tax=Sulfurimicrobium lacus TaxID=2715678 RepID=A0A6F8VH50_9PROT|nr:phage protease [Sulfurimicrobium lacus]BCB28427.1 hypothetical protein SKTS_33130 [Sulfurimicrobium lacus]